MVAHLALMMLYQPETWPMMCSKDSSTCAVPMLSHSPCACCRNTCIHMHNKLLSTEGREWAKHGLMLSGLCPPMPRVMSNIRQTDTNDGTEHSKILPARQDAGARATRRCCTNACSTCLPQSHVCPYKMETPVHADCT